MKNTILPSMEEFKAEAKQLRTNNPEVTSHSTSLHILAKKYGYKNWNTIRPVLMANDKLQICEG